MDTMGQSGRNVMLTTHLQLVPRLRMEDSYTFVPRECLCDVDGHKFIPFLAAAAFFRSHFFMYVLLPRHF